MIDKRSKKNMVNIALISCVKQKCNYRTKVQDMCTSALFRKSLKYAKDILKADKIFCLSSKYGFLTLAEEIDPYNVILADMNQKYRYEWSEMVIRQLKEKCDIKSDNFVFLAGKNYYENIIPHLQNYEIKMEGLTIGKRHQWLNQQLLQGSN
jgi:hypothetical protein